MGKAVLRVNSHYQRYHKQCGIVVFAHCVVIFASRRVMPDSPTKDPITMGGHCESLTRCPKHNHDQDNLTTNHENKNPTPAPRCHGDGLVRRDGQRDHSDV